MVYRPWTIDVKNKQSKPYTMYLAYSALQTAGNNNDDQTLNSKPTEQLLRYQAYKQTCTKYSHYIAEIQRYFPGWMPKFQ